MPPYSKLNIVLPCHSLEDFPIHHKGDEAANLLANWTALWHPALIVAANHKPNWHQADNPDVGDEPEDNNQLVLIPTVANSMMDSELVENFESQNAIVIADQSSRAKIVKLALEKNEETQKLAEELDPELTQCFHALGYAFLQVQIMTRQLRYSSNLDEEYFSEAVVAAAKFATDGDHEKTKEALGRCFDLLLDEKNGYYPVDPDLIDVVLTADTTLGAGLDRQLDSQHPINVLMTGAVSEKLAATRPDTTARLKELIDNDQASVIGGLYDELPEPLVSTETTVNQIRLGIESLTKHLGIEPQVFMRRRAGLHSAIPGVLDQFNFVGAIHSTLDDGKFPQSSNSNIRWTGDDDRSLLAFGDVPLSAADAGSFIGLGVKLGEAIDSAHVAAAIFVHWPDNVCESFRDLVRIAKFGPLFGTFTGLNEYFDSIYDPGYGDTFTADEYKTPFLKQAVERQTPNPVSRYTSYWTRFYQLDACRGLLTQACARVGLAAEPTTDFQNRIADLQTGIEAALNQDEPNEQELNDRLAGLLADLKSTLNPVSKTETSDGSQELINPSSTKRRIELATQSPNSGTLKKQDPIALADGSPNGTHWIVDVPAMGAVVIDDNSLQSKDVLKSDPAVGTGNVLRNEFFELTVDETTGGIRSIQLYAKRANLASQQLAMRIPAESDARNQPLTRARYTRMEADSVQLEMESRLAGRIVSRGRLLDSATVMAEFKQIVRVVRGKPLAEVDVELSPLEPFSNSFNHYLCSRLAWKSEGSRVIANAGETRQEVNTDWFRATNFMEIAQDENRLTMFTGGLPFHRRASRRMVDSILMVGNEKQNRFKFALAVNAPYAMAGAVDWMTPQIVLQNSSQANENLSRWLFHFNCKNILATWSQPFFDKTSNEWAGVHIRLRETEGRKGKLAIRCPRTVASGEQVNFGGDFIQSLEVAKDDSSKLEVEFGRFDYFQISIRWKR